jgi:xylan 1,4-beta-xylosidase
MLVGARTWRALRAAALLGICGVGSLASASPGWAAGGLREVRVDASRTVGTIRSLQGVSGTPLPGDESHADFTRRYRQLGVDVSRTHDIDCQGTGDLDGVAVNRIFPDWSADPNDPSSYNFAPTDRAILSVVRSGARVEFNLGRSDLRCAGNPTNNAPPADANKYAAVARHVARHYNDGWAGGYRLGIRDWEIWNEPDLLPFWAGTSQQYYALYAATARALKSLHSWMRVGGPALTTNNDLTGYRESLLEYIRANHLPLDFWSIHHYSDFTNDPLDFKRLADASRALLDRYGFTRTAIHLTEWNYALTEQPSAMQRAAYAASSLILMQDAPLERAVYHRADREGGPSWQLINDDGTLSKPGRAFEAVGAMQRTPLRLATSGGDDQGLSVEAGRTHSRGAHGEVRVLLSNYEIPVADQGPLPFPGNVFTIPGVASFTILDRRSVSYTDNNGYDLTVTDLPGRGRPYLVSRYRVDETHDLTLVDRSVQRGGRVRLSATLPAPSVELVVIRPAHGPAR